MKQYEVWTNGYTDGICDVLPIYFGEYEADSFDEACKIALEFIGISSNYEIYTTKVKFYDSKEDAINNTDIIIEKYIDRSLKDTVIIRRISDGAILHKTDVNNSRNKFVSCLHRDKFKE